MASKEMSNKHNVNMVKLQSIHKESVKKERKYEMKNFKKEYTFSPYTCNILI